MPRGLINISSASEKQRRMREIELSRRLAELLKAMPYELALRFQNALSSNLETKNQVEDFRREIRLEASLKEGDKGERRRLDVLVPCALTMLGRPSFEELIFELKLFDENIKQVNGYAEQRPNALVVSLAKKLALPASPRDNVVRFTWEQFFWGLAPLLTLDGQLRILDGKLLSEITLKDDTFFIDRPDTPKPTGEVFGRYLEDFLFEIKRHVRFTKQRVIVVTGKSASKTTTEGNIYFCPANWDAEFDYLVVVHSRKIQYVGKVKYKLHPIIYDNNQPANLNQIIDVTKNEFAQLNEVENAALQKHVDEYEHDEDGLVVWLQKADESDGLGFPKVGKIYEKKGAITQTHRYFESPEAFTKHFTEPAASE